jgi:hypothetical protein
MILSGLGDKALVPVFFMLVKVGLKIGPRVFHGVLVIPGSQSVTVDSSFLEGKECEFDGGSVGHGCTTSSNSSANDPNAFPEVFECFIGVPSFS